MKTLNELTTKADELYTSMEDESGYHDVQNFMDDTKEFLDNLINYLESIGGRVDGMGYKSTDTNKETLVCESCNLDVDKNEAVGIISQGEVFCHPCYEEWRKEYFTE